MSPKASTVLALLLSSLFALDATAPTRAAVSEPTLKWAHGGCFASWCETGWYASPAVRDLDGDGQPEVIASAYSIVILDGPSGALELRVQSGHDASESGVGNVGRTWPGIVVADVDGDGALEIVTAHGGGWVSVYTAELLFEPGWPRRPVTEELRSLAVSDLDGDGEQEILYADFAGKVHAVWLDGTEHGDWPYEVYDGGPNWRFASEPVVVDLDRDGSAEVLFGSWVEKGSSLSGSLHVVSAAGTSLYEVPLPAALSGDWNGALAAPTLADIDGDPDLEIVLQTAHSGVVAYDLPGSAGARVHWGTGRGSYLRSGVPMVVVFTDGFESGDTSSWSTTSP